MVAGNMITNYLIFPVEQPLKPENPRLVHAIITGRGPIEGVLHPHAWVEITRYMEMGSGEKDLEVRYAIDHSNGNRVFMPAMIYRMIARAIPESILEYTPEEVRSLILKHEHWGPWEEPNEAKRTLAPKRQRRRRGRSQGNRQGQRFNKEGPEERFGPNQPHSGHAGPDGRGEQVRPSQGRRHQVRG